jgi:opacity protein-like surface antigen
MSKKFFAIVAVMAALTLVTSAAYAEMEMEVGAMAGVNIADLTGDDAPDNTSTRVGFLGGGFFGMFFNENFGARVEVNYAMKGAKADVVEVDETGEETTEEVTWKLDYVEIPVLAVGRFPVNESFTFSAFAGPVIAFNMTSELSNSGTVDLKDYTKSTDFGVAFGVGGEFPVSTVKLFVQGRATIGLTTVSDEEDDPDTADFDESDQSIKTIAYGGVVGVAIPLSTK